MAYDAATALAYETGKTGTGWTVDVTVCNLSADLSTKDFKVWIDDTLADNADFTKTSAILLTYGGTATTSAAVEVHRSTTISRVKTITPGEALDVADIENELENVLRIGAELQAFYQADPPTGQAGFGEVLGQAYGSFWDGKIDLTATKKVLYDIIETQATLASPTFTGTPTCPDIASTLGSGNYTAANKDSTEAILQYQFTNQPTRTTSPTYNTDNTSPATTAFVKDTERIIFQEATVSGNVSVLTTGTNVTNINYDFGSDTYDVLVLIARTAENPSSEPPTGSTTWGANHFLDLNDSNAGSYSANVWNFDYISDESDYHWHWAFWESLTGDNTFYWKARASSSNRTANGEWYMQMLAFWRS